MSRNPARSRPLSKNVKRLMKMAREHADNPNVMVSAKTLSNQDFAYCDLQGDIFMSALDLGYTLEEFTPVYMNSQLAGVIDYSFSAGRGMENDRLSSWLKIPLLVKSPGKIAALAMWLDEVSEKISDGEPAAAALVRIYEEEETEDKEKSTGNEPDPERAEKMDNNINSLDGLIQEYEYAYWLGYIYRFECLLHTESSRMVYGAFPEPFMRETYGQMMSGMENYDIENTAPEICRRIDMLLSGKLWAEEDSKG